jgi:hypothetical protein
MYGFRNATRLQTATVVCLGMALAIAQALFTFHDAAHDLLDADEPCLQCDVANALKHPLVGSIAPCSTKPQGIVDSLPHLTTDKTLRTRPFDPRAPPSIPV